MKVSIITSVLNGAKVLPKCIESVKSQSYQCEHIIVDGGSTDKSQDIARNEGVRLVIAPGSNISEAFNIGIKESSGNIIAILNADDWLESDAAERAVRKLEENPNVGFTYGAVVLHYPTFTIIYQPRVISEDLSPYATKRMLFYHISSFVRRSVYEEHGFFDPKLKVAMDYDFYARVTTNGVHGAYVDGIIAHALVGGVSSNIRLRMHDYYFVLSQYYGKFFVFTYIAKYIIFSQFYNILSPELKRIISNYRQRHITVLE